VAEAAAASVIFSASMASCLELAMITGGA